MERKIKDIELNFKVGIVLSSISILFFVYMSMTASSAPFMTKLLFFSIISFIINIISFSTRIGKTNLKYQECVEREDKILALLKEKGLVVK